jgi:hypothetical protein
MSEPRLRKWTDILAARFPDLVTSAPGWDPEMPYGAFGSFAISIRDRIRASGIDDRALAAFTLINEMAEVRDDDVENLIVVGFLEVLCDEPTAREAAQAHLTGRAKALLDDYLRWPATSL